MRTTLDIDDGLMGALMERHLGKSKTEAIEEALRAYLAKDAIARLRSMAGHFEIEDASTELRAIDRK